MAHHGHEVALSTSLDFEHAKAVLGVMEGDALNRACQRLDGDTSLELRRSDHLVHALVRRSTAAPAPSTLRTQSLTRDARLASVHDNLVLGLFYGIGAGAVQGPHTRPTCGWLWLR